MKRPEVKDRKVSDYIDYLESKIEAFSADNTKVKSYNALKSFIEANCKLLEELDLTNDDLASKEDKKVERALKFSGELLAYNKNLDELAKSIEPILLEKGKKEAASGYEATLRKLTDGK